MGGGHHRGVVIPAKPGAAFVVVQAELALELLVVDSIFQRIRASLASRSGSVSAGGWRSNTRSVPGDPRATRRSATPRAGEPGALTPPLASRIIAPPVCRVHAREDEPRADGIAVGSVAERDDLRVAPEIADQIAERSGPRPGRAPPRPRLASGPAPRSRCLLEHLRLRSDRQHVSQPASSSRSRSQVFSP